jgi:single-stranded DNA-binding protein
MKRATFDITGRIGFLETKDLENSKLTKISLPVEESFTNKAGEKVENTHWFNIEFWGQNSDFVVLTKAKVGDLVRVKGQIKTQMYQPEGAAKELKTYVFSGEELDVLLYKKSEDTAPE